MLHLYAPLITQSSTRRRVSSLIFAPPPPRQIRRRPCILHTYHYFRSRLRLSLRTLFLSPWWPLSFHPTSPESETLSDPLLLAYHYAWWAGSCYSIYPSIFTTSQFFPIARHAGSLFCGALSLLRISWSLSHWWDHSAFPANSIEPRPHVPLWEIFSSRSPSLYLCSLPRTLSS